MVCLMRSYIINLEHSLGRMSDMVAQFSGKQASYERIVAIDGKTYQGHYLKNSYCQLMNVPMTANEVACFLSHRLCWEKIANGQDSHGAVFEDDVFISSSAWDILAGYPDWLHDVDLLKIETFLAQVFFSRKKKRVSPKFSLLKAKSIHPGGAGYILSKNAALDLLSKTESYLPCAVDNYLFYSNFYPQHNNKTYHLSPAICVQTRLVTYKESHRSTIDAKDGEIRVQYSLKKKTGIKRLLQNFIQPVRRMYYKKMYIPFDTD